MTSLVDSLTQNALPGVLSLHAYTPGMPIDELQRRLGIKDVLKLASNENPLGASPAVRKAVAAAAADQNLGLYPDGSGYALKQAIARYHDVQPEQITLGNGSNDILEFLSRIYAGPGRAVMFSDYAFAVYSLATQAQNAEAVIVPAFPADHPTMPFGHDLAAFARVLKTRPDVSLVFIANPNNPTGTWNTPQEIEAFLDTVPPHVIVALDEAYFDYQDVELRSNARAWLDRYPNLLVCRTFSKIYGIAALRVGYSLSHPAVADLLNRVRQPFNNNALALIAAEAALADQDHVRESVELNAAERLRLPPLLQSMGLKILPSQANFLTIDFARNAAPVHQGLLERGIIVRPMASYGLPNFLRVSIGTRSENNRFIDALRDVLGTQRG
ncbi:histidinol-phosphate aminotransferase [Hydrocarboniphaga daqingensis]|uniref:Histidinol-phosphate aminotransferase n=1 Tax=Hydrocarboniphaga daqingensis TaxID=490188 RepID=A0A1M5PU81_9GAMM|nr:histidinol-phosphate transaminase [Hydrocarboniphaga daqingensis]SHH05415.1 histidinol-phosphate aminotransferase [Hydrocarboniphaga daqingensis]